MIERLFSGVYLGDFAEEGTRLLGRVPGEAEGGRVLRSVWVLADPLDGDPTRYWTLTVGRFESGPFISEVATSFPQGFATTPVRVDFGANGVRVPRGSLLAIRATPSGPDTVPLTGVSVIPVYAESSPRAR